MKYLYKRSSLWSINIPPQTLHFVNTPHSTPDNFVKDPQGLSVGCGAANCVDHGNLCSQHTSGDKSWSR